jgi:phosphohistidine phosphatase SixA
MENRSRRWHRGIAALAAGVVTLAAPVAFAQPADKLRDLASVLGELRKGGLVIYFRHASTDQSGPTDEAADMANCATQRNLSALGREQAEQTGKAFLALGIPVGTVMASPFCRTRDTAKLAFGRFTVSNDLYYAIGTNVADTTRFTQSLRRMLSTPPSKATNSVLVSHTANLREATGIWPKPEGAAYVFRPLPDGKFEAIAMIAPEDWGKVAALAGKLR